MNLHGRPLPVLVPFGDLANHKTLPAVREHYVLDKAGDRFVFTCMNDADEDEASKPPTASR